MGPLKPLFGVAGSRARVVIAFLLLELVASFWVSTAKSRPKVANPWLENFAFPQEKETSRDKGDKPTPWIISWIGAGDLTQYTISNAGQSGYFEPPPNWSGYDGTFPDSFAYGNGLLAEFPAGSKQYYNFAAGIWVGAPYPEVLGNDTTWTPRVSTGAYYSDMGAMSRLHQSNEVFPEGDPHSGEFKYVQPGCEPQPWQELWPYADTSLNSRRPLDHQIDPDSGHIVSDEDTWAVMGDWIPEDSASTIFIMGYDTDGLGVRLEQRTYSWHSIGHDQYIYFNYKIKNMNNFALDSVYVGYFMDNDIGQAGFEDPEGGNDDLIGYNRALNLGYTYDSNGSEPGWKYPAGYIGSMFCKTPRDIGMTGFQTWTREGQENLVDNTGRDDLKYAQLACSPGNPPPFDTDPEHQFETFTVPRDVRHLMASGPFRLESGEETKVTVAVVAGFTFEDLVANADSALAQYERGYVFTPYIDNDAPIVYSASADPVCTILGDTVNISVYVKDASPIQSVMATIESPYGVFVDSVALSPRKGETYSGSWTTTPGIERHYNINVTTADSLNNSEVYKNLMGFTTKGFTKTADILVVDDDGYNHPNWSPSHKPYESYYTDALDANGFSYDVWHNYFYGIPSDSILKLYSQGAVIWLTGDKKGLTEEEGNIIATYLREAGGNIFLSGQEVGSYYYNSFFRSILSVENKGDVTFSDLRVSGVESDTITNGMKFDLNGGTGADNQLYPDVLEPRNRWTEPILTYDSYFGSETGSAAIKHHHPYFEYKAVYLGFGFEAIDSDSMRNVFMEKALNWFGIPSGIDNEDEAQSIPKTYSLGQNYPNPFNAVTKISYTLPRDSQVKLEIYNILGQRVTTLVKGKQKSGYKTTVWDANLFASGIYFYRLQAGDFVETKKMVLLK